MSLYARSSPQASTSYQVKDVGRLVRLIFSGVFWTAIAYGCFYFLSQDWTAVAHGFHFLLNSGGQIFGTANPEAQYGAYLIPFAGLILATFFAARAMFRFGANFNGVVVDLDQGIVSYPGGGVIRNNFSDLFRMRFLFQTCYRFVTELDQIRMIEPRNVTVTGGGFAGGLAKGAASAISDQYRSEEMLGQHPPVQRTFYLLYFNGSSGAVSLSFSSEGKRDEVYSFIRQYQRMGVPVVQA
jgi:hypothetical protein